MNVLRNGPHLAQRGVEGRVDLLRLSEECEPHDPQWHPEVPGAEVRQGADGVLHQLVRFGGAPEADEEDCFDDGPDLLDSGPCLFELLQHTRFCRGGKKGYCYSYAKRSHHDGRERPILFVHDVSFPVVPDLSNGSVGNLWFIYFGIGMPIPYIGLNCQQNH